MNADVDISGRRLQLTRIFNARRERVFSYWASGDRMQQWSGCSDATACRIEMDFRIGGSFTQTMQIAGCGEFTIVGTYDEIVEPERIAYRVRLGTSLSRVVVQFVDLGERTKVILTQDGFSDDVTCTQVTRGTTESFDALERIIGAPVETR